MTVFRDGEGERERGRQETMKWSVGEVWSVCFGGTVERGVRREIKRSGEKRWGERREGNGEGDGG